MLSVGGSSGRSRSKSPGRPVERDRSRSRDVRAPSPSRRGPSSAAAPPPSSSRSSKKYYEEEEDEDDLVSDDDDRRRDYSRAIQKVQPREYDRRGYSDEEEEEEEEDDDDEDDRRRHATRHADPRQFDHRTGSRRDEKDYAIPGQFDDEDDRGYSRKEGPPYAQPNSSHVRTASTNGPVPAGYGQPAQWQYQQIDPRDVKYVNTGQKQYTRTPSESGPSYQRAPASQVTVEPSRSSREGRYANDPRADAKYRSEVDKYRTDASRYPRQEPERAEPDRDRFKSDRQKEYERAQERQKELARLEKEREVEKQRQELLQLERERQLKKEREELIMIEQRRREIDHLKKEREERESELRQKPVKSVTIRDDRDKDNSRKSKRSSKYEDNDKHDRRGERKGERRSRSAYEEAEEVSEESEDGYRDRRGSRHDDRYEDRRDLVRRDDRRRDREEDRFDMPGSFEARPRGESDARGGSKRAQFIEIQPGGKSGVSAAPLSPGLTAATHRLSVSGNRPSSGALTLAAPGAPAHGRRGSVGAPPGSPLLESYRGTYQTISPMPSPMAHPLHHDDSDLSDFELDITGKPHRTRKHKDRSRDDDIDDFGGLGEPKSILKRHQEIGEPYDPDRDAVALANELKKTSPSADVLIKILPTLRSDSIVDLRSEYKKHAKIQGKGINIAKHIKMKLGNTNVGKAAYATALGRWESEAHWANFWYQSGSSRRELLIECLFGRSNAEIRAIREAFSDKRYGDSLVRCMEAELKKDKFRLAVLKALEAKRGEEGDEIDKRLVLKDVAELYKAVTSKEGGETAMINIIVARSDEHLRLILTRYEAEYGRNFAKEMIAKSQNLVGETLAHILNGVLNRPVRDALLLHQAIEETSRDRAELIISRLVRYHWEPRHLERVKIEYRRRYGIDLQHDIEAGTKGDFAAFCVGLTYGAVR